LTSRARSCFTSHHFNQANNIYLQTGVVSIASSQDTTGPLAKSAWDIATALSIMAASTDPKDRLSSAANPFRQNNYTQFLSPTGLEGLRIGVPRKLQWNNTGFPSYMEEELERALDTLRDAGATIVDPVLFGDPDTLLYDFPAGPLPIDSATRRLREFSVLLLVFYADPSLRSHGFQGQVDLLCPLFSIPISLLTRSLSRR
jgi:hypothetical protein